MYLLTSSTASMTGWILIIYVFAACLSQHAGCEAAHSEAGKYFITAPSNVVRGSTYVLTVQILEAQAPVNISVFLERDGEVVNNGHTQRGYIPVTVTASKTVTAGSLDTLAIKVPLDVNSQGRRVRAHVLGTGGLQIEETFSVSVQQKIASAYAQTDKSVYQPGERVTLTTFALGDLDLAPYTKDYEVMLMGPHGDVMTKWFTQPGAAINTFHFDLEKHTFQGDWTVTILGFDSNGSFAFPAGNLLSSTTVKVTVTEDSTGLTGSGQATVRVFLRDVKVEFTEQTPSVFRPKLPFTAHVKISNHADEPLQIPVDSVYRTVHVNGVGHYVRTAPADWHSPSTTFSGSYPILARKLTLPDSGLFSLDMDIPDDVSRVDLIVTFQGVQKKLTLYRVDHAEGENYLQISLLGDVPRVTDTQSGDVRFRVMSSKQLSDISVELVSRGQVVLSQKPTLTNKAASGDVFSAEFTLTLTWAMTPVTEVIAYHVSQSNHSIQEVVSDSMAINVQGLLENVVEVTSDRQRVEPEQEIVVHVRAKPGSNVGILVEKNTGSSDQALTEQLISNNLRKTTLVPLESNQVLATSQQHPHASFSAAGITTVDGNGQVYITTSSTIVKQTAENDRNSNHESLDAAFLGTNITGPDGTTMFSVTLPDSVSMWSVKGFAFDSAGHVGVVSQSLQIEASYPVYGEVLGPDHVVSGEHLVLTAYVHNHQDVQQQVNVTLMPLENVELLDVRQNGPYSYISTSDMEHQQTVTVPAKGSKQVFFTVTTPQGTPKTTANAYLTVTVDSGSSTQTIPYTYTVVPEGVEQTATSTSLINVQGHLTQDVSSLNPPSRALPGTTTRRVKVTGDFDDLVLPLALAEEDLLEEGTGPAALLHLALPVMIAKAHPELIDQLRAPTERAFQRLMTLINNGYFNIYKGSTAATSASLHMAASHLLYEASRFIYIDGQIVANILSRYFNSYSYTSVLNINHNSDTHGVPGTLFATEAFTYWLFLDEYNYVRQFQRTSFDAIYTRTLKDLRDANNQAFSSRDPLGLSYLALANIEHGDEAAVGNLLSRLLSLQDLGSANSDVLFWNTTGYGFPQHRTASCNILTAANALKLLLHTGQTAEADRVARWLLRQRQASGVFREALDTMTATEALLAYSIASKNTTSRLHVHSTRLHNAHGQGHVANFTATGQGKVITQVEMTYHVTDDTGDTPFDVVPVVLDESLNSFKLMICSRWLAADKSSGAVVQEVSVPSGFVVGAPSSSSFIYTHHQQNSTLMTVYMAPLGSGSECYTLPVVRAYPVAQSFPAYITTRSFDTPENMDIVAYQPRQLKESTVCDFCPTCCV